MTHSNEIILLLGGESSYQPILSKFINIKPNHYKIEINSTTYDIFIAFAQSKSIHKFATHAPSIDCLRDVILNASKVYVFGICGSCKATFSKNHILFPSQFTILSKQELLEHQQDPLLSQTILTNEIIQETLRKEHLIQYENIFTKFSKHISNATPNTLNLTVPGIVQSQTFQTIDNNLQKQFLQIHDSIEMECYEIVLLCKKKNLELGVYLQVSDVIGEDDFSFDEYQQFLFRDNFFYIMNNI